MQRPIRLRNLIGSKMLIDADDAHDLNNADMHSGRFELSVEHISKRSVIFSDVSAVDTPALINAALYTNTSIEPCSALMASNATVRDSV